jgi:hypothetical protein
LAHYCRHNLEWIHVRWVGLVWLPAALLLTASYALIRSGILFVGILLAVLGVALGWVLRRRFGYLSVCADEDRVAIMNVVRTVTIPWSSIASIDGRILDSLRKATRIVTIRAVEKDEIRVMCLCADDLRRLHEATTRQGILWTEEALRALQLNVAQDHHHFDVDHS